MQRKVIIQLEVEGFHNYENAPSEVKFLSYPHRHTFVIKCEYEVLDLNREKEIFIQRELIKDQLIEWYGYPCQFNGMSCEMIAEELLTDAIEDGMVACEVWEESTGGARVSL